MSTSFRDSVVVLARRAGLEAGDLLQQFPLIVRLERSASDQQLVEDYAEAEYVATAFYPVPFATGLFGRHVGGGPSVFRPLAGILFFECQPKVDDVRLAVTADQDVARLHIPMDDSLRVGIMQGVSDGGDQFGGFPDTGAAAF